MLCMFLLFVMKMDSMSMIKEKKTNKTSLFFDSIYSGGKRSHDGNQHNKLSSSNAHLSLEKNPCYKDTDFCDSYARRTSKGRG
jgi:hypothetical protein